MIFIHSNIMWIILSDDASQRENFKTSFHYIRNKLVETILVLERRLLKFYNMIFMPNFILRCLDFYSSCHWCQSIRSISRRSMMPLNPTMAVEFFNMWGIDFMGPFPLSFGHQYILVYVNYVSKQVEAIPCRTNDHKVVIGFLKSNIVSNFRLPRPIINDCGTHFYNKTFIALWAKYFVTHKVAIPYHSQISGQVKISNRGIKYILEQTVKLDRKEWSLKLDDSLQAY